jgi:hypothetical protein
VYGAVRPMPDLLEHLAAAGLLQIHVTQLAREGSSPPGLRRPQAKLSRNSNQVARGRIRRFESDMPSQAAGLPVSRLFASRAAHTRLPGSPADAIQTAGDGYLEFI